MLHTFYIEESSLNERVLAITDISLSSIQALRALLLRELPPGLRLDFQLLVDEGVGEEYDGAVARMDGLDDNDEVGVDVADGK